MKNGYPFKFTYIKIHIYYLDGFLFGHFGDIFSKCPFMPDKCPIWCGLGKLKVFCLGIYPIQYVYARNARAKIHLYLRMTSLQKTTRVDIIEDGVLVDFIFFHVFIQRKLDIGKLKRQHLKIAEKPYLFLKYSVNCDKILHMKCLFVRSEG